MLTGTGIQIAADSPLRDDVAALLDEHLQDMYATSPPESVHALDHGTLAGAGIVFVTARAADGTLLGCGALKELGPDHGELKSMRTTAAARGRGIASAVLEHLTGLAERGGYRRLSLETGVEDYFAAARRLYARHGFTECGPFADYTEDPNSVFMTKAL
ncbi:MULTISPECIES: GNAT family N-acetyltransferase [Streptomyces]|uniref:GNAT family N-acetyltransferase n=1 Tax=Streptomyces TaxID=1883 RepID=UPI00140E3CD9|nr:MULTISPECIES: GNAT family N-acetyltransferase [Streptomyces]MDH6226776.1 putative acetyltransferase [Streptomyces sp. MJP52]